jgi:hypothetical protein
MLGAFAWLVSNFASMFGAIFNRHTRDWHMGRAAGVQPLTPSDFTHETLQAAPTRLSTGSGPPAAFPTACLLKLEERMQKAGTRLAARAPSLLSFWAKARSAADPEPGGHERHRHNIQFLWSRFRGNDNPFVHLKSA